ncbi:MAG: DNA gyrase inhibitor YacG [Bdellovibrionota bacterium]
MKCPYCKKEIVESKIEDLSWLPFCSKRCKLIDLGAWASEKYVIPETMENSKDLENLENSLKK